MGRRAQETDFILRGGPAGEFAGSSSTGDLRRGWRKAPFFTGALLRNMEVRSQGIMRDSSKRTLETGQLSLWAPCEGNLEGGSITGHPEGYVEEGSGDGQLSIGARCATWGGASIYWEL